MTLVRCIVLVTAFSRRSASNLGMIGLPRHSFINLLFPLNPKYRLFVIILRALVGKALQKYLAEMAAYRSTPTQVIEGQYLDQLKLMNLLKHVYGFSNGIPNFRVEV